VKRVLLISNAYAGSVSTRAREVIAKALSADFKLENEETVGRGHASELARDAVDRGFDAVVAFGGDGTANEAAQALVGTDVALALLPGGSTNVMVRSLGMPLDPVDATAYVAARLRSDTKRRINVGRMNERYFLFSAGMGLDAEVVKRVEADPDRRLKSHNWLFVKHALAAGSTEYRSTDPWITLRVGDEERRVLVAVCCNGRPFTYFRNLPVDVCPEARLDLGLDIFGLMRIRATTIPRIVWALFISRGHIRWKTSSYFHDIAGAELVADKPLPVQVDGDYLGDQREARLELVPNALDLLV
jgi:diacylglycerol kinase family enzyme